MNTAELLDLFQLSPDSISAIGNTNRTGDTVRCVLYIQCLFMCATNYYVNIIVIYIDVYAVYVTHNFVLLVVFVPSPTDKQVLNKSYTDQYSVLSFL